MKSLCICNGTYCKYYGKHLEGGRCCLFRANRKSPVELDERAAGAEKQ